jgi:hypothetical protein
MVETAFEHWETSTPFDSIRLFFNELDGTTRTHMAGVLTEQPGNHALPISGRPLFDTRVLTKFDLLVR